MSRTPLVYGPGDDHEPPASLDLVGHPVPVWWRGTEPDHDEICRRYVEQKQGPPEIAVALGISLARVNAALSTGGVVRRDWGKRACPLSPAKLRAAVEHGATVAELARTHGVSSTAAKRWLADTGLLAQDPELPAELLTQLYVDERKSTRRSSCTSAADGWYMRWPPLASLLATAPPAMAAGTVTRSPMSYSGSSTSTMV